MEDGGREEEAADEWEGRNEERKKEEGMMGEGWKKEGR